MKKMHFSPIISTWVLILIIMLGVGLRLQALSQTKNVDEPNIIRRAVMMADGQQHIHWYHWPAQSLMRINAVAISISTAFDARQFHRPYDAAQYYRKHEVVVRTLTHLTTVGFAAVSILLVYLIGKHIESRQTGLLASLFLAVGYLHVKHSRFTTPDVPLTTALLGALLCSLLVLERTQTHTRDQNIWHIYFLSGSIIGFAVATKYTGIITSIPIILAGVMHGLRMFSTTRSWRHGISFFLRFSILPLAIGGLLTHTIFNPFAIVDLPEIQRSLLFEAHPNRLGAGWEGERFVFLRNLWYYTKGLLVWSGTGITSLAFLGMLMSFFLFRSPSWYKVCLVTGTFVFILIGISLHNLHWSRWAIPLTPLIAIMAAYTLMRCIHITHAILPHRFRATFVIHNLSVYIMIAVIVFPQIILNIAEAKKIQTPSVPIEVSQYIQTYLPPQSVIVADTYYVTSRDHTLRSLRIQMFQKTVAAHQQQGVNYIIVKPSRLIHAREKPERYKNIITFFEDLEQDATLVKKFSLRCDSILQHKRDAKIYQWVWQYGLNEFGGTCKGQPLWLYQL